MAAEAERWKREADAIWSRATFDRQAAADLVAAMIRGGDAPIPADLLRQTYGTLRQGLARKGSAFDDAVARSRFGQVRTELYRGSAQGFGKRSRNGSARPLAKAERDHRALLHLPEAGELTEDEVTAAYRAAARRCHPDAGGTTDAFQQAVRARDELLEKWASRLG